MQVPLAFAATRWPWSDGRARATSPPAASHPQPLAAYRQNAAHKKSGAPRTTPADCPASLCAPARELARPSQPFPIADQKAVAAAAPPASLQWRQGMAARTKFLHLRGNANASSYSRRAQRPPNPNQLPRLMNLTDRGFCLRQQKMVPYPSTFHPAARDKQKNGRKPALRADPASPTRIESPR